MPEKGEKKIRWYLLWFFTSGMWLITCCVNLSAGRRDWVAVVQFLNILLTLSAGIVNRRRYKRGSAA